MLEPIVLREIDNLTETLKQRFESPEFIPGCAVKSISDKDQYATNNGWIEALCGRHNQQRCRYRGSPANIGTTDFIDVLFFPDRRLFEIYGQGGTAIPQAAMPQAIQVVNSSGGTASYGDVGYLDEAGEYQTTTTASDARNWCAVTAGGDPAANIYVTRRGIATLNYTGSAPAKGDFLVTSTTAGKAQAQATMRPEILAVATAAGSGGTVQSLLLTGDQIRFTTPTNEVFRVASGSVSDFVATIATLPGGATLTYNAPSSGDEANIKPNSTSQIAKMLLHNTTQGDHALISDVDTGTNTITLTANVPGTWAVTDTITMRSQTNTDVGAAGGSSYFCDWEFTTDLDELTRGVQLAVQMHDTGSTNIVCVYHPFETGDSSKRKPIRTYVTSVFTDSVVSVALIQKRFCVAWNAGGANTVTPTCRLTQEIVAAP